MPILVFVAMLVIEIMKAALFGFGFAVGAMVAVSLHNKQTK